MSKFHYDASNDFSKATIKALAAKNIRIVGAQAVPADENDVYFSDTGYVIDNNGQGMIRKFSDIIKMARA